MTEFSAADILLSEDNRHPPEVVIDLKGKLFSRRISPISKYHGIPVYQDICSAVVTSYVTI